MGSFWSQAAVSSPRTKCANETKGPHRRRRFGLIRAVDHRVVDAEPDGFADFGDGAGDGHSETVSALGFRGHGIGRDLEQHRGDLRENVIGVVSGADANGVGWDRDVDEVAVENVINRLYCV